MIGYLSGKIIEILPTQLLLDVNGVGYEILVPLSFGDGAHFQVGSQVSLYAHLAVRDDAHILYGFNTRHERDFFRTIIQSVSGIGPKMGLNILSAMPIDQFKSAVASEDVKSISSIPGIGKKTAERIIVELKDKVGLPGLASKLDPSTDAELPSETNPVQEAIRALVALQIKPVDAVSMVEKVSKKLGEKASTEQLVKACLQKS